MKRRADTPLTILALGLFTVVVFGLAVIYSTGRTPVLRLAPELDRELGHKGFRARYVRGLAGELPYIEVTLPQGHPQGPLDFARVGRVALDRYRKLAERTTVEACWVYPYTPPGAPRATPIEVNLGLLWALDAADEGRAELEATARRHGVDGPSIEVAGLARSGVHLRIEGQTLRRDGDAVARGAAAAISSFAFVGRVDIAVEGPGGRVERRAGRDGR